MCCMCSVVWFVYMLFGGGWWFLLCDVFWCEWCLWFFWFVWIEFGDGVFVVVEERCGEGVVYCWLCWVVV